MTVDEFKAELTSRSADEIVEDYVLGGAAIHVREADRLYVAKRLAEKYGVAVDDTGVWIVGSAKLGFSISQKRLRNGRWLRRFRPFRPSSDIDVAVVSPPIYRLISADLSRHAYSVAGRLPWDSGQLGHYLVHGWVRPDHFPKVRLRHCDAWWDIFNEFSRDPRFRRRKVRGALFHSFEDLVLYHSRSVRDCQQAMELNL